MTLIDYFKQFEAVSAQWHFSANTRSLYIAILSKFNSELKYDSESKCALYTAEMYLLNGELQKMSGILSNSSFDAARGALIASKLITYKKQHYTLCALENQCKCNGNGVENVNVTLEVEKNERKKTEDITPTAPRACEAKIWRLSLPP